MKVLYRIIYAIVIALGLYLTIDLTNSNVVSSYIDEHGKIALEDNNLEYFVSSRYYHLEPLKDEVISFDHYTFRVLVYNTANIRVVQNEKEIVEGFQIIMHLIDGPLFPIPFTGTVTTLDPEIEVAFVGMRLSSLPIYTFIAGQNLGIFYNMKDFMAEDETISILNLDISRADQLLYQYPLDLSRDDFKLSALLQTYLNDHDNESPTESFGDVGYAPVITINTRPIVIRNASIYVAIAFLVTIISFTVKRKTMGRRIASPGLKTDIQRLQDKHVEKR